MAIYEVPREMASGFITIGGTDLTAHVRAVESDEDLPLIDLGTVSDPSATALGRLAREVTIEFKNSFSDGTTDGLYDLLDTLADGTEKAVVFQPYGTGTGYPQWDWNTEIGFAPMGSFTPDEANIVELTVPVRSLSYTKAV